MMPSLVLGENLLVDARAEVEAFEKRDRGQLEQVLKPVRFWASSVRW